MGRKKEFAGIWIPREVWEDDRLSLYDKAAFAVISGLARGEGGCFATNRHLADYCKVSERQVCKSVAQLAKTGYIRVENSGTPVRRIFLEERTLCAVRTHDVRGKNAPCADIERTTCAVRTHDVQGSDENLPNILYYNNIYNNNYNNMSENKPTLEEIKGYISEQRANVDPVKFYGYYNAGDWLDRKGNPINWRQKVLLWDSDANKKRDDTDAAPAASSFDTDDFFAAALTRAGYEDTADGDCPWMK